MTEDLSSNLSGAFGRPLRHLAVTGSTNSDAMEWAAEGAPEGAVVVADHQTGGRGRWGRTWASSPGGSLLCSVILRPEFLPPDRMGLLSVMGGVAAVEAVAGLAGAEALLKWPNDVVVGDRKLAGILAEGRSRGPAIEVAVIGIGVNIAPPEDLPPEVLEQATSLRELGMEQQDIRALLLPAVLERIGSRYAELREDGGARLLRRAAAISSVIGHRVTLRFATGEVIDATATGLSDSGALEIDRSGRRSVVDVAEVTRVRRA